MSKLVLNVIKSTNFHNPSAWINVGECVLSFFFIEIPIQQKAVEIFISLRSHIEAP